ncbi:MAG TPA: hypothetical protein VIP46_21940 [Pyrinomonadaceae bacterium]
MGGEKKKGHGASAAAGRGGEGVSTPKHPAIGIESEFIFVLNEREVNPRDVFEDPRGFIRGELMHRIASSYHIPTGGAIYFDNGVIEVATPLVEIGRGCAVRAGRSLWESIMFVRDELDDWERRTGNSTRLLAFSTHYNVSFDLPEAERARGKTAEKCALLLSYILPAPVMLLAANKRSTGIGVRPRGDRVEVTADFTPSSSLMIATATLVTGVVREVMRWESFELGQLEQKGIPRVAGFKPMPHTSRKGWLARFNCFPRNPFVEDPDARVWETVGAGRAATGEAPGPVSMREIAREVLGRFTRSIAKVADPFTLRLIHTVISGAAPSLLQLPDRPKSYDNVGRLCRWERIFPERLLSRSQYERILIRAISGRKLTVGGEVYTPVGMKGWTSVIFLRDADATKHSLSIDFLLDHLDNWERS